MDGKGRFEADLTAVMALRAAPDRVLPLLCPVREALWIPGWEAEVLHSRSGVAEPGCVFRTREVDGSARVWVVTRHEPGAADLVQFLEGRGVIRLEIRLSAQGEGTRAEWRYCARALEPGADGWMEAYTPEAFRSRMGRLETLLNDHLEATAPC